MSLKDKKILLAISGSIAAYKAAVLTRLFIKEGAEVRVLMTPAATQFISPLTLSTLSKHSVYSEIIDNEAWNNHVELGLWADVMLVAPATATTISKMANANCDNIVTAVYLSAKCPVFFAPAMDRDMWLHPANQKNIETLIGYGNKLIDVEDGELASGLTGKGRMAEPEHIVETLNFFFQQSEDLKGKTVLITAGPTYESIDPVRFIGNRSSGKMGMALAEACARRNADVKLILGPSQLNSSDNRINIIRVQSGQEMYEQAKILHQDCDVAIFAAAVADYKVKHIADEKIKKADDSMSIELVKNIDIALSLGKEKREGQIHIGFALETQNEESNAKKKLIKKNFDLVVLNSLKDKGAGFGGNTNKVTLFHKSEEKTEFDLKSKNEVAEDIVNTLVEIYL
ncbi:MAG: bifunctional phosphopantothenoylcysteine decarboxylase/phosphopantothenate--cysteine ligase CoaBC [Saprospiraceae bacterium]|nr:bifunctional phosphopantothenoylcysteine decarboxylase/phosphopantothenate--cysteine ligase CoaBC [Saprospiraceae bacterium]